MNFIRNQDVTFTPSKPRIGVHFNRCIYTQSYINNIFSTDLFVYAEMKVR